jgi:hypothetical protein
MAAMFGWTVSAYVTVKNSIKQHTINTLLQSRLSAQYMSMANVVAKQFTRLDGTLIHVVEADLRDPDAYEKMEALRYVLNYFEFISVGVLHGDLHEPLLKATLRGMLCRMFVVAKVHVEFQRKEAPKVYENFELIYHRWKNSDGK